MEQEMERGREMERWEQRVKQGGWDGYGGRAQGRWRGIWRERGLNKIKRLKVLVSEQSCIQENHNADIPVYCNGTRRTVAYLTWSKSISQYRIV